MGKYFESRLILSSSKGLQINKQAIFGQLKSSLFWINMHENKL